jgi:hypothetical protein
MAWSAYVASIVGDVVGIELLLLDLEASELPAPVFEQARLEGSDTVDVTAVEALDVELAREQGQPYLVSLTLDEIAMGSHEYTRLAYIDEQGVERSVDIGTWRFEVIPRGQEVIEQTVIQMGGTELRRFSAELMNNAAQSVAIDALALSLPHINLTSTMFIGEAPDASGDLASAEPGSPTTEVEIPAGERRFITFDIAVEGGTPPPFVAIQPLIEYRLSGDSAESGERTLPLGYTRYTPAWNADGYLAYCATRPPEARHPLG